MFVVRTQVSLIVKTLMGRDLWPAEYMHSYTKVLLYDPYRWHASMQSVLACEKWSAWEKCALDKEEGMFSEEGVSA